MNSSTSLFNTEKSRRTTLVGFSLLFLFYSVLRAVLMCLTTDEAFSYFSYVRPVQFLPESYDSMTANFHLVNTWGMIVCNKLFGSAEWSLRLPNLLAHVMYLYFTARFAMKSRTWWSMVAVFLLLNAHPYLLDFFSVARGYGLSFGFLAGAAWYLTTYSESSRTKHLLLAVVFSGFGMWSSFMLLHVHLALLVIIGGLALINRTTAKEKITQLVAVAVIGGGMIALVYPVMSQMKEAGAMTWAQPEFWNGTLRNLLAMVSYNTNGYIEMKRYADNWQLVALLAGAGIVIAVALWYRFTWPAKKSLIVILGLLLGTVCSLLLVQATTGTGLPHTRTGLFLFVLFLFVLAFALRDTMLPEYFGRAAVAVLLGIQLILAAPDFNFTHTQEWNFCSKIDEAIEMLAEKREPVTEQNTGFLLACDIELYNVMRYYSEENNRAWLTTVMRYPGSPEPTADYYLAHCCNRSTLPSGEILLNDENTSLLLLFRGAAGEQQLKANGTLPAETKGEIRTPEDFLAHTLLEGDSSAIVNGRINVSVDIDLGNEENIALVAIWCERNGQRVWDVFKPCEAVDGNVKQQCVVGMPMLYPIEAGDVVKVIISPFGEVPGPIDIANVKYSLWAE